MAVWVIVAAGVGKVDRRSRLSRGRSAGVSRRRGRRPLDVLKNSQSLRAGGFILHSLTAGIFLRARGPRTTVPLAVLGETRLASRFKLRSYDLRLSQPHACEI